MREVMDESDMATVREQQFTDAALSARKAEGPAYTGFCAYCGEATPGVRFCDADCRDGWDALQMSRVTGRVV